jgi:hypothetical protein
MPGRRLVERTSFEIPYAFELFYRPFEVDGDSSGGAGLGNPHSVRSAWVGIRRGSSLRGSLDRIGKRTNDVEPRDAHSYVHMLNY